MSNITSTTTASESPRLRRNCIMVPVPVHSHPTGLRSAPARRRRAIQIQFLSARSAKENAAAAITSDTAESTPLSSLRWLNEIRTACWSSLPDIVRSRSTLIADIQLPVDIHGEPAKTLHIREAPVNVAAAPFSMFESLWD